MTEHVKAGGENRPFKVSYKVLKDLGTIQAKDKNINTRNGGFDLVETQFFLGFKYGALSEGKPVNFTKDDIADWLEQDISLLSQLNAIVTEGTEAIEGKKKKGSK